MYVQKLKKRVKVIASRDEQVRILNSCHSDPTSGHLGTRKTWRKIAERFYWKGLSTEVKEFVATCDVCQRMNQKLTTGVPELHPIEVKSPWHMIGIDFVGPLAPPSHDGHRYILRNTLTKSMQNQMHMLWGNLFLRKTLLGRYVHAIHTCA